MAQCITGNTCPMLSNVCAVVIVKSAAKVESTRWFHISHNAFSRMRTDDFPIDLFSLQLDELNLVPDGDEPSESAKRQFAVSQATYLPPIDLLLDDSKDSLLTPLMPSTSQASLPLLSSPVSPVQPVTSFGDNPFVHFVTPSPTPPDTPSSRGRTPCSSGQSSPRRHGNASPTKSCDGPKEKLPRYKRPSHIKAEQKRRSKIQKGFEEVMRLVPSLAESLPNSSKQSKSAMLSKTADYCRHVRNENKALQREADKLRAEIRALTADINTHQGELPAAGMEVVPTAQSTFNYDAQFQEYVRKRTTSNWKFWIFGMIISPLFQSFKSVVQTSNVDDFYHTLLKWLEEHCSLVLLRPATFNAVRNLSTHTSVLTHPECLPEEAMKAVEVKPNGLCESVSSTIDDKSE